MLWRNALLLALGLKFLGACSGDGDGFDLGEIDGIRADVGVDIENRIVYVGALVDESGPAASIGHPWATGTRILAAKVNAGGSGMLPEGWRIDLIERDHGYNPQRSVQAYNEIRDQVLYITTSFGTPTTLPLRPLLERDRLVAIPASLSSLTAQHQFTPVPFASYRIEAMRAMDWAVEQAGGPGAVRAAVVYQQDDYGQDGLEGWRAAAAFHGVELVSELAVAPGQSDFTAIVSTLRSSAANYILITALPSSVSPLLGTAAQLEFAPTWVGNTPSWGDEFFDPSVVPPVIFESYYNASSVPFWGEDVPGMQAFLEAYEEFGRQLNPPNWYIVLSYLAASIGVEAFRIALEADDVTREGFLRALGSIDSFQAGGLLHEPVSLSTFPYQAGTLVRVMRPAFESRSWTVVSDYAVPKALESDAP